MVQSRYLHELQMRSRLTKVMSEHKADKAKLHPILWALLNSSSNVSEALCFVEHSKSQLYQDLFVLGQTQLKQNGFFVEFGASDGVSLSNSYLLEKQFGWSGILAEPARGWQKALIENRRAVVDERCVFSKSGMQLTFNETKSKALSTLDEFSQLDHHAEARRDGLRYQVETISLEDLLIAHGAPQHIDYLSIDTEGSELKILEAFDFSAWTFGVITVEHNHTEQRERIYDLLTGLGYLRWRPDVTRFDDWYVYDGERR